MKTWYIILLYTLALPSLVQSINHTEALQILGLKDPITLEMLNKQFRKLSITSHPDKFPLGSQEKLDAEEKFKKLGMARDFLEDELLKSSQPSTPQTSIKGYANAEQALQDVLATHANVFAIEKSLTTISEENKKKWNTVLENINGYIQMQLNKERSFGQGISTSNRELFADAQNLIKKSSANLFDAINVCYKITLYDASLSEQKQAHIKRCSVIFNNIIATLKDLQNRLKPGLLDVKDTKDIKNLLSKTAFVLEETSRNVERKLQ